MCYNGHMTHATTKTTADTKRAGGNPWESNARAAKAAKLIAAIDGVLPHIFARTPEMALNAVLDMGDVGWASAASIAGVNLPSEETKDIVLDTYRRRVRASVDAQIAESIAGALKSAGGGR
jgi:hypothetical protein